MSVCLTIIFRNTCNTSRADILLLHSITVLWLAICKYIILCCSNFLYFPLLYAAGAPRFLHALGFQPRLVEMTGRGGSTAPFYLSFEKGGGGGIKAAERSLLRSAAFMPPQISHCKNQAVHRTVHRSLLTNLLSI